MRTVNSWCGSAWELALDEFLTFIIIGKGEGGFSFQGDEQIIRVNGYISRLVELLNSCRIGGVGWSSRSGRSCGGCRSGRSCGSSWVV